MFAIISAVSILHFFKVKKKGNLSVSIGFVLLTIGWLILPTLVDYIHTKITLTFSGWELLYLSYVVFYVLPTIFILIGFILHYKEPEAKTPRVASTPP
jgi:hypothetical protein